MKTFDIYNLGCKVNAYESDAIANMLEDKGYIKDSSNPDMIVVNTCSVTSTSNAKSRQKIRHLIKKFPNVIMCVMGCYSQMNAKEASEIDGVSVVIGTRFRDKLLDYALEFEKTHNKIIKVVDSNDPCEFENLVVYNFYDNTRAYLKIQDGCNNFCSYCIIPYTRGRVRSKDKDLVISEAINLVNRGYKELVLTGIHTGGYGLDFKDYKFYDLLKDLLSNVKGLERLRISSIEINELTDEVIELIKNNNIIVNHLHVPIQSGCDVTLKAMNRKYDLDTFKNRIAYIKSQIKDVSITTDVIVGFPNESEKDFEITYNSLKEIEFTRLHVFPFSSRELTVASKMNNHINGDIKKERVNKLLKLSKELEIKFYTNYLNKELKVLFEEEKDGLYKGYTTNYIRVVVESNKDLKGKFADVKLLDIIDNGLDVIVKGKIL